DGAGNTVYTSWFFAPEVNAWKLMATWSRPKTEKYLMSSEAIRMAAHASLKDDERLRRASSFSVARPC
ncbi:MAG: DUF3472 domain-containing protein, partial [Verrucomicrobiaceae bacterium]